jgi:hypothetical protein
MDDALVRKFGESKKEWRKKKFQTLRFLYVLLLKSSSS